MYTGIIDHCGVIQRLIQGDKSIHLWISCNFLDVIEGESIAVNGFCVTALQPEKNLFQCDISPETFCLTNAQYLTEGSIVNLERSLQLQDRLGGHFVMGHVDKVYQLSEKVPQGEFTLMNFSKVSTGSDSAFLVKKGSVSVNGISLTINEVSPNGFQVMVIPHTLKRTNLHLLTVGDKVNIEFDLLVRITVNYLQQSRLGSA
jgi:riboflavin synthase